MEREILIGENKVSYIEEGEGTPIIIWHGWDECLDRYLDFQKVLAGQDFKVFLLRIPGLDKEAILKEVWSSEDYARWLLGFSGALRMNKFFLLGHSFGTLLSTTFAALYPEKLFGLILFAPPKGGSGDFNFFKYITFLAECIPFILRLRKKNNFILKKITDLFKKPCGIYERSEGAMLKTVQMVFSEDMDLYIKKVGVPTLIVYGKKDNCLIARSAKKIFKKIPHSILAVFEKGDHFIQEKYPEDLVEVIKKFQKIL